MKRMIEQERRIKELMALKNSDNCPVIAITSGKGGVGKTNIAANLAIALAEKGEKVLVVDADTNFANVDVLLGLAPKFTLLNYVLDDLPIQKILMKHESGIDVIPNSSGSSVWKNMDQVIKLKLFELLYQMRKKYDYIILDTAAGLSPLTIDLAIQANQILIVTTAEPTAISDTYAMIKVLDSVQQDLSIDLLHNMVTSATEVTDVYQRLSLVLQHFLDITIGIAGYIELDDKVRQAIQQQIPVLLSFPDSPASLNIHNIAESILNQERVVPTVSETLQ